MCRSWPRRGSPPRTCVRAHYRAGTASAAPSCWLPSAVAREAEAAQRLNTRVHSAMRRQALRLQACLGDAATTAGALLSERLASSSLASVSGCVASACAVQGLPRGDVRALRAAARAYTTLVRQQGSQAGAAASSGSGVAAVRRALQVPTRPHAPVLVAGRS